ncbi:Gfo/Idh/MocA family oxidoreductase [Algoriphagus halophytocola]|uniref:Gfo/Idh/MocA family oxidoreductase n=1 Tax=Algoriphagus halophytocola TaxID=2991499 RepID=A0ABY6MFI5_9BACT|nr:MULTISPECIES: Gfo/Idh/MocA family oxidoreductase [unclassified Algoriphagus]UZD22583.1 Gfo/Idh/MocA family oxidoreductase [Algoriphagus sp. TR-M5]WBL43849.1 Gfo/Idh/MocA family oxidoreductase [Algoriphagus sp. TR-M9]
MLQKISICLFLLFCYQVSFAQHKRTKIGVAGLTHGHVGWILNAKDRPDLEIVGIAEPNRELAKRLTEQHGISMDLVFDSMTEMLDKTQPEAVTAFGNIYDHLAVVEACAPRGIHVMVEKPLAVSLEHAEKMKALAEEHDIHLITNYETTWYPSTFKAQELLQEGAVGELRKIIVRDGHKGPKKIGVNEEFLEWLTDPKLNGGGAIIDFGCYGANLVTWLHQGKRPNSVTAVTNQLQPENNPKVDDEATIILNYEESQAIIQASWNWPIGRKDMEIYGLTGAIYADNPTDLRVRIAEGYSDYEEKSMKLEYENSPFEDPFTLLLAVVHGDLELEEYALPSLENNLIVVEILSAAVESAKSGKTVYLK